MFNDFANEIYGAVTNLMDKSTRYRIFLRIIKREIMDVVSEVKFISKKNFRKNSKSDSFFIKLFKIKYFDLYL